MKFETVERDEESLTTKVPRIWFFDSLAINLLFSEHQKYLYLIFIYLSDLVISIGNHRLLKHASIEEAGA
jgi:hypothetical protein